MLPATAAICLTVTSLSLVLQIGQSLDHDRPGFGGFAFGVLGWP